MPKCQACGAEITFAVNLKSLKAVPLVPYEEGYADTFRYTVRDRSDGQKECERDNAGAWMSHYANCSNPKRFSGRNKR